MKIKFINTIDSAKSYIEEVCSSSRRNDELWDEILIKPYWDEISQWAPFDCSFMKPSPINDIEKLKIQLGLFQDINIKSLETEFARISNALPKNDDDTVIIALYPLDDENAIVKKRQNGVVGSCVFGNIVISINPLAKDYGKWIPYVMAHEYHHSVWGHNWYVLRGNAKGTLLEYMINEGQADAFARDLFGSLQPQWLNTLTRKQEELYWGQFVKVLESTDRGEQTSYMFGDESKGLPWCLGYHFGYEIVKSYMENNSQVSFAELIDIEPEDILNGSRFYR